MDKRGGLLAAVVGIHLVAGGHQCFLLRDDVKIGKLGKKLQEAYDKGKPPDHFTPDHHPIFKLHALRTLST